MVRRQVAQHFHQLEGVIIYRTDAAGFKHLRKGPFEHLTVFEYVGYARRATQVVFQHEEAAVTVANQVGAGSHGTRCPGAGVKPSQALR